MEVFAEDQKIPVQIPPRIKLFLAITAPLLSKIDFKCMTLLDFMHFLCLYVCNWERESLPPKIIRKTNVCQKFCCIFRNLKLAEYISVQKNCWFGRPRYFTECITQKCNFLNRELETFFCVTFCRSENSDRCLSSLHVGMIFEGFGRKKTLFVFVIFFRKMLSILP
jgi:hypothetical protein